MMTIYNNINVTSVYPDFRLLFLILSIKEKSY